MGRTGFILRNDSHRERRRQEMGARQKLNSAYLLGSVVLAGWIGAMAQSFFVFLLALGFLVALKCYSGDIRPSKGRRTR